MRITKELLILWAVCVAAVWALVVVGITHASGQVVVTRSVQVKSERPSGTTAWCPRGYIATGGGFTAPDRVEWATLLRDEIAPRHQGWTVRIKALVGAGHASMRVQVTCDLR